MKTDPFSIFLPNRDRGLYLLPDMAGLPPPQRADRPRFDHVIAASHPAQVIALQRALVAGQKHDLADISVVLPSFPVHVQDLVYDKRQPRIGGKLLLSGASGKRIRTRFLKQGENGSANAQAVEELQAALCDPGFRIPTSPLDREALTRLPFVIETKNFFNFYHYTTEALIYLGLYQAHGLQGEIRIVTSNPKPAAGFVMQSIRDFYPELLDRITLHWDRQAFDDALVPFNLQHYFAFQRDLGYQVIATPHTEAPGFEALYPNVKAISRCCRDAALDRHRALVLDGATPAPAPRLIYVRRKSGKERAVQGEALLLPMLRALGFAVLSFEDYTPKEQARLIHGVDVMVSAHGAGFTNMIYAKPGAVFVELSNLQNVRHRFGDFHMHAAVSGARHVHFFVDHDFPDPQAIPDIEEFGHLGVSLSEKAVRRLEGFLRSLIQRREFLRFKALIDVLSAVGDHAGIVAACDEDPRFLYALGDLPLAAAEAHQARGDHARAAEFFGIALEVAPFRAPVRERQVHALIRAGDLDGARQALAAFQIIAPVWHDRFVESQGGVQALLSGGETKAPGPRP